MKTLLNENKHTVSSGDVKIRAGQAKRGDGPDFDTIAGYRGVRELSGQEADDALARSGGLTAERSPESELAQRVADERRALNHVAVSAPLQVVVGDDAAPLGPPSGVVSTKVAEAAKGPTEARAFGENEAFEKIPGGTGVSAGNDNTVADIHNAQAEATQEANAVAEQLAQGATEALGGAPAPTESEDDGETPESPESDPLAEDGQSVGTARKDVLIRAARFRGLDESGGVDDLRDRIREHDAAQA